MATFVVIEMHAKALVKNSYQSCNFHLIVWQSTFIFQYVR